MVHQTLNARSEISKNVLVLKRLKKLNSSDLNISYSLLLWCRFMCGRNQQYNKNFKDSFFSYIIIEGLQDMRHKKFIIITVN